MDGISNTVAGASGIRQFYPTTFTAPFGLPNLCPPIPLTITQVMDCENGASTYYDGYNPDDQEGGTTISPTAFNVISYGDCP